MSDRLTPILNAIVSKIAGRGFRIDNVELPVMKRKAPVHRQKLDPSRMITVSKSDTPEQVTRRRFGLWQTAYVIDVTVVSPFIGPDADQAQHAFIRDMIVDDFKKPPLANAADVFELNAQPANWLRPFGETTDWDWQSLQITATVAHA